MARPATSSLSAVACTSSFSSPVCVASPPRHLPDPAAAALAAAEVGEDPAESFGRVCSLCINASASLRIRAPAIAAPGPGDGEGPRALPEVVQGAGDNPFLSFPPPPPPPPPPEEAARLVLVVLVVAAARASAADAVGAAPLLHSPAAFARDALRALARCCESVAAVVSPPPPPPRMRL